MENEDLGLSPRIAGKILGMDILPDAKMILIAMLSKNMKIARFHELSNIINCPIDELDTGRTVLSSDRINVSRRMDEVSLNLQWLEILEENNVYFNGLSTNNREEPDEPNAGQVDAEASDGDVKAAKQPKGVL